MLDIGYFGLSNQDLDTEFVTGSRTLEGSFVPRDGAVRDVRLNRLPQAVRDLRAITGQQKGTRGTITLDGDTTVPAGLVLRAGKPAGMIATQGQTPLEVTYTGAGKLVSPGLTVPLTFNFSTKGKASSIVVDTPVDAGSLMERKDKDPADSAEEGGHH